MKCSVDVVIINWNGRDDTLRCVASVHEQALACGSARVEIVVVDNGSSDGTAAALLGRFPDVRVVELAANRGFTGGIRAGVEFSDAEFVIFLNNDAEAEPGWLTALVDAMRAAPDDVVAIGGRIVDWERKRIDFVGGVMTFDGHGFQRDFRKPLGEVKEPRAGESFFACGGNMIVRRATFVALGGFDDDYFAYLEDVDFGWRAWIAGYRILYEPAASVRHHSSLTSDRLGAFERGVLFERNAAQTVLKNFAPAELAGAAGAIFMTLLHRLHAYAVSRNDGGEELQRPAFGESRETPGAPRSLLQRARKKLVDRLYRARTVVIHDPLTIMQFRAIDWLFRNSESLMRKREAVQLTRARTDAEIFARFPLHVVPTYIGDRELMASRLFRDLTPNLPTVDARLEDIIRT
ncbi:MAG: glycosyltransferase family 2 protein [Thermoanaerobaculia bacterium]